VARKLPNKDMFTVIDLGNNAARFGLWSEPVNWQHIFKSPEFYLENLRDDRDRIVFQVFHAFRFARQVQ
jgi:hypothetical protein